MLNRIKQVFCKHEFKLVVELEYISNHKLEQYYKPIRKVICSKCSKKYKLRE